MTENIDPYVYPGTTLLENLRDIRDHEELGIFEALATSRRIAELGLKMKPGKLDAAHLQAIHKSIFQDVYPWAGKFRTVDIARSGQFYFAFAAQIVPALEIMFGELRKEQHLGDLDTAQFCKRAAFYIGELNAIHPFCDGNRRTQCEFIRQLALRNRCLFIGRALREIRCTMHLIVVFCTGLMPGLKKFFCPRLPELGIVD